MFELKYFTEPQRLWDTYAESKLGTLPPDDRRHDLAKEIRERIRMLEYALAHSISLQEGLAPDPQETQLQISLHQQMLLGHITVEQMIERLPSRSIDPNAWLVAFDGLRLYAESFYENAWRIRQILNGELRFRDGKNLRFPDIGQLRCNWLVAVRNHLVQHPERQDETPWGQRHNLLCDDGYTFHATSVLLKEGRAQAPPEGKDLGFLRNARRFHDALCRLLEGAVGAAALGNSPAVDRGVDNASALPTE